MDYKTYINGGITMKKMIVRADDVGYTHVYNIGTFESIDNGIVTSADIMLESPGTVEALELLKERPWISIGWHAHFWFSPVLPVEDVKSLLIPNTNRFRADLQDADATGIDEEELRAEMRTQMNRCLKILGRVPDTTDLTGVKSTFNKIKKEICDEYGIAYNFATKGGRTGTTYPDEKWKDRNILIPAPNHAYEKVFVESLVEQYEAYDPIKYYLEDPDKMLELPDDVIFEQSWHPGYVDYTVYKEGDNGPRAKYFTIVRAEDVHALTSDTLKNWVKEHKIELINFRDALYGTNEYQNHLRAIDSNLYMKR
jgi:predicted glycoside hydrolase/deacetylase ChbG (UPF0249 family)